MRISKFISSHTAADILHVSVSTVKRWVDENILPASKTPGGHRKILVSDLIRLSREGILPFCDLSELDMASDLEVSENLNDGISDNFYKALKDQNGSACKEILLCAYKSRFSIEKIADDIIQPSMARIGHEWSIGELPIFFEHCATQICLSSILELKNSVNSARNLSGPVAVGGCPANDFYQIPNMLVELILCDLGWHTINMGSNTPFESFLDGIKHFKAKLVWMSITEVSDIESFIEENKKIFDTTCESGSVLVLGGQGLVPAIRKKLKFHFYGDTLSHLGDYVRGLFPPPSAPQRGRPPLIS